jgi:hypothetical protein
MITSLGDSGLPVCQAGHWSWQRPHSVQVVKSSSPFQVKSSTLPAPSAASSSRSSISAKSSGFPSTSTGGNAPRAGRPEDWRLNQMLGQTVNRCQATPIVVLSPMVMNQAMEMTILTAASSTMAVSRALVEMPAGNRNDVSGKWTREVSSPSRRNSKPRISSTQTTMPKMVSST